MITWSAITANSSLVLLFIQIFHCNSSIPVLLSSLSSITAADYILPVDSLIAIYFDWEIYDIVMLIQETTDYARPIIFTVETELLDLDQGPVLDDSWPTTVKTQVRVCRSREALLLHCMSFVNNICTHYEFIMKCINTCKCKASKCFFWFSPASLLERVWRRRPLCSRLGVTISDWSNESQVI